MVKKVVVQETLLKQYTDKELIHYISSEIKHALGDAKDENLSSETDMALRLRQVSRAYELLTAVDKRMNGDTGVKVVL